MILSVERLRAVRQHPKEVHAELVSASTSLPTVARIQEHRQIQPLWREYVAHDEDGVSMGVRRDRVNDVAKDGELIPAVVTLLHVDRNLPVEGLDLAAARSCGFKTASELKEAWASRHPRTPDCHVVYFVLGDARDQPLFMNWTGGAGGDYTRNRSRAMDEAEALTREQMADLSAANRQKDDARRAQASVALATETPSQRLLRLQRAVERMGDEARRAIRQEMRIIKQRVERAEGRK